MKHSWSIEEEAEQNEIPAPPLTSEELEAVEELKANGTLYSGNDVEPW